MNDDPDLGRRYRRLLACYPAAFRREHEQEVLSVLMAGAEEGQRWPRLAEVADLLRSATSMRLRTRLRTSWAWEYRHRRVMVPVRVVSGIWLVALTAPSCTATASAAGGERCWSRQQHCISTSPTAACGTASRASAPRPRGRAHYALLAQSRTSKRPRQCSAHSEFQQSARALEVQPPHRPLPTPREIRRTLRMATGHRHPQPPQAPQAPDSRRGGLNRAPTGPDRDYDLLPTEPADLATNTTTQTGRPHDSAPHRLSDSHGREQARGGYPATLPLRTGAVACIVGYPCIY
jgi:hypothetical protein